LKGQPENHYGRYTFELLHLPIHMQSVGSISIEMFRRETVSATGMPADTGGFFILLYRHFRRGEKTCAS
jgi:hypothetical protein